MARKDAKAKAKKKPNVNERWSYSAQIEYSRAKWDMYPRRRGTSKGKHK